MAPVQFNCWWLLNFNITDAVKMARVFNYVQVAIRNGKDMTVVKKELEEKHGILSEPIWG